MAEITVPMRVLKELVAEAGVRPFESGEAVAMPYGHHLVRAYKRTPTRIFRNAIPMLSIGYSGVASWTMSEATKRRRRK